MNSLPNPPEHWTDEQLIASFYDAAPENSHIVQCAVCRERLSALLAHRQSLERMANDMDEVSFSFLAAQRRQIYSRLSEPVRPWSNLLARKWASAATLLVLGGGFIIFEQNRPVSPERKISDVQLAQEMSRMSQDLEAQPVAPLQGLFE